MFKLNNLIRKIKWWVLFGVLLSVATVLFFVFIEMDRKEEAVEIKGPRSVAELNRELGNIYKKPLLLGEGEKKEDLASSVPRAFEVWQEFAVSYADEQPGAYKKTRDWKKKIITILEFARKADELVKEKKYSEAERNSAKARAMFEEIRDENGFLNINSEMLAFYESAVKVSDAETREEVAEELLNLKYNYTVLKQFSVSPYYTELISELEEIIGKLDKLLDGPDFREAKEKLMPVFMELYEEY